MKTVTQIKLSIHEIVNKKYDPDTKLKDMKADRNQVKFLNKILLYMETKPSESLLIKQKASLQNKRHLIEGGFEDWVKNDKPDKPTKNLKSYYRSMMGLSQINTQLKYLNYILK